MGCFYKNNIICKVSIWQTKLHNTKVAHYQTMQLKITQNQIAHYNNFTIQITR